MSQQAVEATPTPTPTLTGGGGRGMTPKREVDALKRKYIFVDGPVDPEVSLIRYDLPFAPSDPKRSLKLRRRLGLPLDERAVDPNVRIVIDSFITPRAWHDEAGVLWLQHGSPHPVSRTETVETHDKLRRRMQELGVQRTGICPLRSLLLAECFLEVIRQVTAECWERGLLCLRLTPSARPLRRRIGNYLNPASDTHFGWRSKARRTQVGCSRILRL
ncbi:dynein arm light chain [Trypanosoma cruzi Dm28c]|uniref:Dynein arm light chain n=1 Tax=Trypanosoma cruzi Dm28c TaxID=1416333 RepID=V5B6H0_TRYCR|nr:dynein arm light chain [Trypanosoma cruzi Dm28c]